MVGTISPSLSQGAELKLADNFYMLAQQEKTKLGSSPAVMYMQAEGKTNNLARMGSLELSEVNLRNPDKVFSDYDIDNRKFRKRRFTKTITIDKKYDINELITDPTSHIVKNLVAAQNRIIDRIIVEAATGDVLCGGPEEAGTLVSAATDGVLTVTATGGLTSAKIDEVTRNFINNDIEYERFKGSLICLTGLENSALMGQTNFISNDFTGNRPVDSSVMNSAGTYGIVYFAGSVSGGTTVATPVLPEESTTRTCVVLAPKSIAIASKLDLLSVKESSTKVNSMDITIDLWLNAMRIEGKLVQLLTTTF
jgi:hypothetical protein